jgi:hypothetical protein
MGEAKRNMAQRLRDSLGVGAERIEAISFQIKYGHDEKQMFMQFEGAKVDHLVMNVAQCDSMIAGLQQLRESFIKHGGGNV